MQDRVPVDPGRVLITPENGAAPYYATMARADNPTQEGTPLNKANLLKDDTAALYGLDASAVPDDALAFLGKYNQHWWRRRTPSYYEAVVGEYAPQAICQYASFVGASAKTATIYYSDNISIDSAGEITLVDPVTTTVSYDTYTNANVLSGKYFRYYLLEDYATGTNLSGIYLADLGTASRANNVYVGSSEEYGMNVTFNGAPLTSERIEEGTWEYLRSSERNAYPDSGTSDSYEYEYLGIPFENAVTAPKIAAGSYVGTGVSTQSEPITLEFGFAPKFVFIAPDNYQIWSDSNVHSNKFAMQIWISGISRYQFYKYNENSYRYFSSDNNGISFYEVTGEGSFVEYKLNRADHVYHYFAVG